MERKLIFLDIDGTLTPPGTSLPPESALAAIRRAQALGHKVFLCSGRNWGMLEGLMKYGFDGAVASAGGYVVCGGETLYDHPMSREKLDWTLKLLSETGGYYMLETRLAAYGQEEAVELMVAARGGGSEAERWRKAIMEDLHALPISRYEGQPVYKVIFIAREPKNVEKVEAELSKEFFVCRQNAFGRDGLFRGELINRDFDKGTGMERVCEYLGASLADAVAFGDSMNDLAMLKAAGVSVCMENGDAELKEISDLVCPTVEADGLYKGFEKLGLI